MAVRVLNSGPNIDSAIEVVSNQEFALTDGAGKDGVHCRIVDGLVSSDDSLVGAHGRGICVIIAQYVRLQSAESSAK
jgi:hypothetical protein